MTVRRGRAMSDALRRAVPAILLLLAGCAGAADLIYGSPTVERVDELREAREYDRALEVLDRLRRDNPDSSLYVALEERIRRDGDSFVRSAVGVAETRIQEGDWEGASRSLEEARDRYAQSDTLSSAEIAFQRRRLGLIEDVEEQHALARARGLLEELPMIQELARVRYDDRRARRRLDESLEELDRLHGLLLTGAEHALEEGDKVTAEVIRR